MNLADIIAAAVATLHLQIDARVNDALHYATLDKAGEHARRSPGQRARWIARDFHLPTTEKRNP